MKLFILLLIIETVFSMEPIGPNDSNWSDSNGSVANPNILDSEVVRQEGERLLEFDRQYFLDQINEHGVLQPSLVPIKEYLEASRDHNNALCNDIDNFVREFNRIKDITSQYNDMSELSEDLQNLVSPFQEKELATSIILTTAVNWFEDRLEILSQDPEFQQPNVMEDMHEIQEDLYESKYNFDQISKLIEKYSEKTRAVGNTRNLLMRLQGIVNKIQRKSVNREFVGKVNSAIQKIDNFQY